MPLSQRRNQVSKRDSQPTTIIPASPPSSLGATIKESLAGGFGAGMGVSIAERLASSLFGPRTVSVVNTHTTNETIKVERCKDEMDGLMRCMKTQSQNYPSTTQPCKSEMEELYQCNHSMYSR